jgi:hypothetical protein
MFRRGENNGQKLGETLSKAVEKNWDRNAILNAKDLDLGDISNLDKK